MENAVVRVVENMITRTDAVIEQLMVDMDLVSDLYAEDSEWADEYHEPNDEVDYYGEYKRGALSYESMVESYSQDGIGLDPHEIEARYPRLASVGDDTVEDPTSYDLQRWGLEDRLAHWRSARETLTKIRMANILERSEWIVLHHNESSGVSVVGSRECCSKLSLSWHRFAPDGGELGMLNEMLGTSESLLDGVRIPYSFVRQNHADYGYCAQTSMQLLAARYTQLQAGAAEHVIKPLMGLAADTIKRFSSDDGSCCGLRVTILDRHGSPSGLDDDYEENACLVVVAAQLCSTCGGTRSLPQPRREHAITVQPEGFKDDIPF